MRKNPRVLSIVLAGGEGKRLMPLTQDRAKPAVPFGGIYRLIDFSLSNIINSGYLKVIVLTQYKSHSLDRHISKTWRLSTMLGNYVATVPAQQRHGKNWFLGSADAIYQSWNVLDDELPDIVLVTGADNIYSMDFSQMIAQHLDSGFNLTIEGIRQPLELAPSFGVIDVDKDNPHKVARFLEKPQDTTGLGLVDAPDQFLASMGNYVFTADALEEALRADADNPESAHDMGGNIVPAFVEAGNCGVYDFTDNEVPGALERDCNYWRDVGTIDAYFEANMDLVAVNPIFNLYNENWPILTGYTGLPPAKFVYAYDNRVGRAVDSIVSPGVIISGGEAREAVLSPGVRINSWANVTQSVILDNCNIGRHARIDRAILDKGCIVEEGVTLGIDKDYDRERGFFVSDGGITVVPRETIVRA